MGVCDLWSILSEASHSKNLNDLSGEVIAVDLSTWICEAENVQGLKNYTEKPYLRNLLHRVIKFTRSGVELVFVADGSPPEIKHQAIAKRIDARSGNSKGSSGQSRRNLDAKIKECCRLLKCLGIPYIYAEGEAEATCAALTMAGEVNACSTTDNDAFLYGATKLYRNLTIEKGKQFECYEINNIKRQLNLNRNDLIALALILGCDYTGGVPGIGKVHGKHWINSIKKSGDSLQRLQEIFQRQSPHQGTKNEYSQKEWKKVLKIEEKIIRHAKEVPDFPYLSVIEEFSREREITKPGSRQAPSLSKACYMLVNELKWNEDNCIKTVLPLLTHWILNIEDNIESEITPIRIVRKRKRDGNPLYEIEWDLSVSFAKVGNQTTLEHQDKVQKMFPELVDKFQEKLNEEKKKKGLSKKSKTTNSKLSQDFVKKRIYTSKSVNASCSSDLDYVLCSMSRLALSNKDHNPDLKEESIESKHLTDESTSSSSLHLVEVAPNSDSSVILLNNSRSNLSNKQFNHDSSFCNTYPFHDKENVEPINNSSSSLSNPTSPAFMSLAERIRLKQLN